MANPMNQLSELTQFGESLGIIWFVLQIAVAIGILYAIAWRFILRPSAYKDIIEVWDITAGKILMKKDRGRWVEDKVNQTGCYKLLKDKKATLKQPRIDWAIISKKGKYKYTYLKTGESGFDYQQLEPRFDTDKLPELMPLADIDWAKHSIKKAIEKKSLSGFWNENKGSIIFVTMAVLTLVLIYWVIGFAAETATTIANSAQSQADKLGEIAEALDRVAIRLGAVATNPVGETPPPGV
jgi:hypothetical protein